MTNDSLENKVDHVYARVFFHPLKTHAWDSSRVNPDGRIISSISSRRILYRPSGIIYQHDPILCTVYTLHCIVFAFNIIIVVTIWAALFSGPQPLIRTRVNRYRCKVTVSRRRSTKMTLLPCSHVCEPNHTFSRVANMKKMAKDQLYIRIY